MLLPSHLELDAVDYLPVCGLVTSFIPAFMEQMLTTMFQRQSSLCFHCNKVALPHMPIYLFLHVKYTASRCGRLPRSLLQLKAAASAHPSKFSAKCAMLLYMPSLSLRHCWIKQPVKVSGNSAREWKAYYVYLWYGSSKHVYPESREQ